MLRGVYTRYVFLLVKSFEYQEYFLVKECFIVKRCKDQVCFYLLCIDQVCFIVKKCIYQVDFFFVIRDRKEEDLVRIRKTRRRSYKN